MVQKYGSGLPLQHMKLSHLYAGWWDRHCLSCKYSPLGFRPQPADSGPECISDPCDQTRHLEALLVHDGVDERAVKEEHVVHYTNNWMFAKVRNRTVATYDDRCEAEKLPSEYKVSIYSVQQSNVRLEGSECEVVTLQGSPLTPGLTVQ